MKMAAIVLCGGESRRMGEPKAWLSFGPERMLQRVVRLVSTISDEVVVVAAPGQDYPPLPATVTVVRDRTAGQGPLEGLANGLEALSPNIEFAFAIGTDTPFLQPAWMIRLHELIGPNDIALPYVDDQFHPLAALYRVATVLPECRRLLQEGKRRFLLLKETLQTQIITRQDLLSIDPDFKTLRNLNSPEDYRQALDDLERLGPN